MAALGFILIPVVPIAGAFARAALDARHGREWNSIHEHRRHMRALAPH